MLKLNPVGTSVIFSTVKWFLLSFEGVDEYSLSGVVGKGGRVSSFTVFSSFFDFSIFLVNGIPYE